MCTPPIAYRLWVVVHVRRLMTMLLLHLVLLVPTSSLTPDPEVVLVKTPSEIVDIKSLKRGQRIQHVMVVITMPIDERHDSLLIITEAIVVPFVKNGRLMLRVFFTEKTEITQHELTVPYDLKY